MQKKLFETKINNINKRKVVCAFCTTDIRTCVSTRSVNENWYELNWQIFGLCSTIDVANKLENNCQSSVASVWPEPRSRSSKPLEALHYTRDDAWQNRDG